MRSAKVFSVSLAANGRILPEVVGEIFKAWVRARAKQRQSVFPAAGLKVRCHYGAGKTQLNLDGYSRLGEEEFREVLSSLSGCLIQAFSR